MQLLETKPSPQGNSAELQIRIDGGDVRFFYRGEEGAWQPIGGVLDGRVLSTRMAGGFVGATIGMYAESGEDFDSAAQ